MEKLSNYGVLRGLSQDLWGVFEHHVTLHGYVNCHRRYRFACPIPRTTTRDRSVLRVLIFLPIKVHDSLKADPIDAELIFHKQSIRNSIYGTRLSQNSTKSQRQLIRD
jgi:hypothetical protein